MLTLNSPALFHIYVDFKICIIVTEKLYLGSVSKVCFGLYNLHFGAIYARGMWDNSNTLFSKFSA